MNQKNLTVPQTADFLKTNDNYLILTHASPDGDTLGSGFGLCHILRSMGKNANVICSDEIPKKFAFFAADLTDFCPTTFVAVDVADPKLLGDFCEEYQHKIDLCIDHHPSNLLYANLTLLDAKASATCEVIYDLAVCLQADITPVVAAALYTGIATDTGCFKFSNTSPKTHRIAAELMQLDINSAEINRIMFDTKSKGRILLEKMALDSIAFYFNNVFSLIVITQEMLKSSSCDPEEIHGIASIPRSIEGVIIGATIREKENGNFKVSLRTNEPYNASQICQTFGGGGHARAAGCEFDLPLNQVKQALVDKVKQVLESNV